MTDQSPNEGKHRFVNVRKVEGRGGVGDVSCVMLATGQGPIKGLNSHLQGKSLTCELTPSHIFNSLIVTLLCLTRPEFKSRSNDGLFQSRSYYSGSKTIHVEGSGLDSRTSCSLNFIGNSQSKRKVKRTKTSNTRLRHKGCGRALSSSRRSTASPKVQFGSRSGLVNVGRP